MKNYILPIAGAIAMVIIARTANPIVEIGGMILAGAIGLGIGVVLNSLILKIKKNTRDKEQGQN